MARSRGAREPSAAHLSDPILQIVVVGDASHLAIANGKKRAGIQAVALSFGRRQPFIGRKILPQNREFRRSPGAIRRSHYGDADPTPPGNDGSSAP